MVGLGIIVNGFSAILNKLGNRLMVCFRSIIQYICEQVKRNPILFGSSIALLPVLILLIWEMFMQVNINSWASFATYTSLGMSITTVIFVVMTYNVQTSTSTVLQFESIFFQWFGIFQEAIARDEDKDLFAKYVNDTANVLMRSINESFEGSFSPCNTDLERQCIRHYKSLYQILRYIYMSDSVPYDGKKKYFDIVQSQLSDNQLLTFFVLLLQDKKKHDYRVLKNISFYKIMDEFHFFKNLYYSSAETNIEAVIDFLYKSFPQTGTSFHWFEDGILARMKQDSQVVS